MRDTLINSENLRQLKEVLPQGSGKRIAEMTGLALNTVSATLNGRSNNQQVLDTAYFILDEEIKRQQKRNRIHEKLDQYDIRQYVLRKEMIEHIGLRAFNRHVEVGNLTVIRFGGEKQNCKIRVERVEWNAFLRKMNLEAKGEVVES
jgi:hypothetical protein